MLIYVHTLEKDKAIAMVSDNKGKFYPEVRSQCVGCGVCEELCPASGSEAAIVIIPRVDYKEYIDEKSIY